MTAPGGMRGPFFPQQAQSDPLEFPGPISDKYVLPPAGHPVLYNNTLGYFPGGFGMRGQQPRTGLTGAGGGGAGGGTRPAPKR